MSLHREFFPHDKSRGDRITAKPAGIADGSIGMRQEDRETYGYLTPLQDNPGDE
jgi:hypothetical protein